MHTKRFSKRHGSRGMSLVELLLVMAIPLLWIGIYPNPVLRRVEPAVLEVLYHMDRRLERLEIPDAGGETEVVMKATSAAEPMRLEARPGLDRARWRETAQ